MLNPLFRLAAPLAILLPLLAPANAAAPQHQDAPIPLVRADVDAWLDGVLPYALERADIAGGVVAIVKDGAILTARGYGLADVAAGRPVDPARTLFRPGSVSKLFTWTAAMQLVEQGRLDLDRDINDYLDFEVPATRDRPITLRHLMTHTAGYEEVLRDLIVADPAIMMPLRRWVSERQPRRIFPPGEVPAYSNYATALTGYLVERASGLAFEDYVEREIMAPIGMRASTFRQPLDPARAADMSAGYELASGPPGPFEIVVPGPAGALAATGEDMARFMIAHLDGGGPLLKPETAAMMHGTALPLAPPLASMRLGFYALDRNGQRIIGHGGNTQFFHSYLYLFLDQDVGLFISLNSSGREGAYAGIIESLFHQFTDRYFPAPSTTRPTLATAREHGAQLVGRYESSRRSETSFMSVTSLLGQQSIRLEGDALIVEGVNGLDGRPIRWHEVEPWVWQEVDGQHRLTAVRDGDGVRMVAMEPVSAITALVPAPWWRSGAWLMPASGIAVAVLLIGSVAWPIRAFFRRRRRIADRAAQADCPPSPALRFWARLSGLYVLAWGVGFVVTLLWALADINRLNAGLSPLFVLFQLGGFLLVPALGIALWDGVARYRAAAGRLSLATAGARVLAILVLLWLGAVVHLIAWPTTYY